MEIFFSFFFLNMCFAAYGVFSKSVRRKTREHRKGKEEKEGMNVLECVWGLGSGCTCCFKVQNWDNPVIMTILRQAIWS